MKCCIALFLLLQVLPSSINAQKIPDYKERSFTVQRDTTEPFLNLNTGTEGVVDPDEYVVGPGDILFLSVSGLEENSFNLPVDNESNLYIPKVGGLSVMDNTLAEARTKVNNIINKYFKNVDVFVTLSAFKKIKVSLIGDVVKPATFVLLGNARLFDLISVSQGLNPTSNFRNIRIMNQEKLRHETDLLSFLRYGRRSENPFLREGDVVLVDKVDKTVSVTGMVKYPGSYEFRENETINELISIAGGLLSKARRDSIEVISFDQEGNNLFSTYYNYDQLINNMVNVKNQDHIVVRQIPEYMVDRYVLINGYIKYPGYYKIIKDKSNLYDIIQEAGGFTEDASLNEATLTRTVGTDIPDPEYDRLKLIPRAEMTDDEYDYLKAKSRQRAGKVVVDFRSLFQENNLNENLQLMDGDVIDIPRKKNYVVLIGQVVNPGYIVFNPSYSYEDYIHLAGGYGWRALEGDVRIIRANTGEWIDADDADFIQPGDAIWVPEDPPGPKFWDVFTTSLTILGQVAAIVAAVIAVVIASR